MQSLDGAHDGRRIVLPVAVLGAENPQDLTHEPGTALLDTGATSSAIAAHFVDRLGLMSIGRRPVMVATEQRLVEFFVFRLALFPDEGDAAWPHVFAETEGFVINSRSTSTYCWAWM